MMTFLSTTARRVMAAAAAVAAGLAVSSAAYGATSSGTTRTAAASIPKCATSGLGAWVAVEQGNGAAGSVYYPLEFTNLSGHTCSLYGFPGVSAVNRDGHQLGSPAGRATVSTPHTVILAPGATAHTILQYSDAAVSTAPGCDPVYTTFELRIYPPDQYGATYAAFDFETCSHAGPVYLTVGPIQPGAGTISS
jgi:hypothetical protein